MTEASARAGFDVARCLTLLLEIRHASHGNPSRHNGALAAYALIVPDPSAAKLARSEQVLREAGFDDEEIHALNLDGGSQETILERVSLRREELQRVSDADPLGDVMNELDRRRVTAWAHEREKDELRDELDPRSVPEIIDRIFTLADRASTLTPEDAYRPGIEAMAWIASELAGLVTDATFRPPDNVRLARRGDVADRHRRALRLLTRTETNPNAALVVEGILVEAAVPGQVDELDDDDNPVMDESGAPKRRWVLPEREADALAISFARRSLERLFPAAKQLEDDAIIAAVRAFRLPLREGTGAPRAGFATAVDRAEAVAEVMSLMGIDLPAPKDLAGQLRRARRLLEERKRKLTGRRA